MAPSPKLPPLAPVAELAGYPLPDADLAQVGSILEAMMDDVKRLRELELSDDVEPILTFRVEPWE